MGCFVPRHLVPLRFGPSSLSLSSSLSLPFPVTALGLLFWRGGESESGSDERTFDGIVLGVALAGVRDRGNEAGRDVDLPWAAAAVVERKVSFPFPRCMGGDNALTSSSPLSVVESTVAWPSVAGPGPCRAALVTDSSPVSFCK